MMTIKEMESDERVDKIQKGLDLAFAKLLKEKKAKNSELIILRDNKIVAVKPEEFIFV
jgi:hypothetical protein